MMIAAFIFVISIAALVHFFVFYTQSLIAASLKHDVKSRVRELVGAGGDALEAAQFDRLLQLTELCPGSRRDEVGLLAVRTYFVALDLVLKFLLQLPTGSLDNVTAWLYRERTYCTHFAAIALDQRTRILLSQNAST